MQIFCPDISIVPYNIIRAAAFLSLLEYQIVIAWLQVLCPQWACCAVVSYENTLNAYTSTIAAAQLSR